MERPTFLSKQHGVRAFMLAGVACLLLGITSVASAQDAGAGISIKPFLLEDVVNPGDVYSSMVKVTNEASSAQTYYVSVEDVVDITPEGGRPLFATPDRPAILGISKWLTYPTGPIDVGPGATVEVPFTVTVPLDASPGSHTGGIFVGLTPQKPEESGTGVGFKVASIVTLKISGDLVEEADIRAFSTEKLFYGKSEVGFKISIENKGNVAIRPRGPIEVQNMFGNIVGTVMVNENASLVFPGATRIYDIQWVDDEQLFFGRLTANATIVYGDQERRSVIRSVSFWMLPMNIILPVLIGLVIVVGGIYAMVKLYIRKHLREIERMTGKTLKNVPKDQEAISRLAFVAVFLLAFTVIFLMVLFFFFA